MSFVRHFLIAITFVLFSLVANAEPIDINTASAADIAAVLNGVGEKKAAAIVAYRKQNGPFQDILELTKVSGIGVKLVENNRDNLMVGKTDSAN